MIEQSNSDHKDDKQVLLNASGIEIEKSYDPSHLTEYSNGTTEIPGDYPYTRGLHHSGYRSRLWTMRMFAGFGNAEDTNKRFKYLIDQGNSGLSVAFDLPTLYGYDSDHPMALGEVGKGGVAISSLADMEILFTDIPLGSVTTSMTINAPAAIIWAMYIVAAEKQGVPESAIRGTIQNDILKEYTAQNEFVFPPKESMRLVVDTIEYATQNIPKWNPISISGYHIREAGSTAVQELAFTLANGFEYVEACIDRGIPIDEFAPTLSFFFNVHQDFFEEIAKFRAARRIWAKEIRETFGAKNDRSCWLRTHAQTAGVTLTAQQPTNNVARVALQALTAVLSGVQSLHTNSLDEALALPTEESARVALRTQQIIANETGVTNTADPLGGSYYLEWLTDRMEEETNQYLVRIKKMGGVIEGINNGFFVQEISDSAENYQNRIENMDDLVIGVNNELSDEDLDVSVLTVDPSAESIHMKRLENVRRVRDNGLVSNCLERLREDSLGEKNMMPSILNSVRAYATIGEIMQVLRDSWGEQQPSQYS
ncbi:MAG: methylmalonyl-CoA mutase family protein [Chloroflexota bacterium]|nr:methylmalonyl-CoA mutase family protein [Chloroflexota bacterium]